VVNVIAIEPAANDPAPIAETATEIPLFVPATTVGAFYDSSP
jgi:hypothetical protein